MYVVGYGVFWLNARMEMKTLFLFNLFVPACVLFSPRMVFSFS